MQATAAMVAPTWSPWDERLRRTGGLNRKSMLAADPWHAVRPVCGTHLVAGPEGCLWDPGEIVTESFIAPQLKRALNETLRWTRSTLAPFALVRLFSLVPHLLPVVPIIPVVTICARAFPVACLSRRFDHAILLAFHGNLYYVGK